MGPSSKLGWAVPALEWMDVERRDSEGPSYFLRGCPTNVILRDSFFGAELFLPRLLFFDIAIAEIIVKAPTSLSDVCSSPLAVHHLLFLDLWPHLPQSVHFEHAFSKWPLTWHLVHLISHAGHFSLRTCTVSAPCDSP